MPRSAVVVLEILGGVLLQELLESWPTLHALSWTVLILAVSFTLLRKREWAIHTLQYLAVSTGTIAGLAYFVAVDHYEKKLVVEQPLSADPVQPSPAPPPSPSAPEVAIPRQAAPVPPPALQPSGAEARMTFFKHGAALEMHHVFNKSRMNAALLGECPNWPCYRAEVLRWQLSPARATVRVSGNFPGCENCPGVMIDLPAGVDCWAELEADSARIRFLVEGTDINELKMWIGILEKESDETGISSWSGNIGRGCGRAQWDQYLQAVVAPKL